MNVPEALYGIPEEATPMRIEISRIDAFCRNPRRARNAEYERIKASIRQDGLLQPLVITRTPGADSFTVGAGGNTRLQILKELHRETGDERFRQAHCLFLPWSGEVGVLLAHLKENELRGQLIFIDRAKAILDAKHLIEAEAGGDQLSLRRLAEILGEKGYPISPALLSQMAYAVDRLLDVIPQALEAGMGQPQVQRIRSFEKAARQVWGQYLDEDAEFDDVFSKLCRRYDGPEWDLQPLRRALEREIADRADASLQGISLALDAVLKGRTLDLARSDRSNHGEEDLFDPEIREVAPQAPVSGADALRETRGGGNPNRETTEPMAEPVSEAASVGRSTDIADQDGSAEGSVIPNHPEATVHPLNTTGRPGPAGLKSLRARAWTLAARLAQRNGFGGLVQPLSGRGIGYVLTDVPPPSLAEHLDEDDLDRISTLWWQLAACAEITLAPLDAVLSSLTEGGVLHAALQQQNQELLFESVWTLGPGDTGYRLWRQLDDRDWQDLIHLLDTYRALRRTAAGLCLDLWA